LATNVLQPFITEEYAMCFTYASSESLVKPGMMTTIGVSSEAELCGALVIPTPSTAAIHFLSTSQFAQHICQFTRIIIKLLTANKPRDLSMILSNRLTMRGYNPVQTYSTPICSAVELSVIFDRRWSAIDMEKQSL
jgi:hypothetical protein